MAYNNTLNGINLTSSNWNTLFNNTVRDNHENGISLTDSHDLNLTSNTAFNNTHERHPAHERNRYQPDREQRELQRVQRYQPR